MPISVENIKFLDDCGATLYGPEAELSIVETEKTINMYGVHKITIEKILFIYKHLYGLEYKIISRV